MMHQHHAAHPTFYPGRAEYHTYGIPGPRGWNPSTAGWPPTAYDLAAAYHGYPTSSDGSMRSPPYHIASPTETTGTPHNIRDILGDQGEGTLPSEVAKTAAGYQKSPTLTTAPTGVFSPEHAAMVMRSPTTPTGVPYSSEMPSSFYMPAGIPRHMQVAYDGSDGSMAHPPGLVYAPGHLPTSPDGVSKQLSGDADKQNSTSKDGKRDKKGRATFSGIQIEELEKAFSATQYLTTAERARLAERLSLSESQVKIWFQNRRTKCRRTNWKSKPTTPTKK